MVVIPHVLFQILGHAEAGRGEEGWGAEAHELDAPGAGPQAARPRRLRGRRPRLQARPPHRLHAQAAPQAGRTRALLLHFHNGTSTKCWLKFSILHIYCHTLLHLLWKLQPKNPSNICFEQVGGYLHHLICWLSQESTTTRLKFHRMTGTIHKTWHMRKMKTML